MDTTMIKHLVITTLLCITTCWAGDVPRFPVTNNKDVVPINENFKDLYLNKANKWTIVTTTPTVSNLQEGTSVLFYSNGAYRLYIRINGLLKYINLN